MIHAFGIVLGIWLLTFAAIALGVHFGMRFINRHIPVSIELHQSPATEVPRWLADLHRKLDLIINGQEIVMFDQAKILAALAKLEASDTAAVAAYTALRDQNKQLATQLTDVSAQLAGLQAGADTAAVQSAIDAIADKLSADADALTAGVAANPAVTNMPPATPPAPAAP